MTSHRWPIAGEKIAPAGKPRLWCVRGLLLFLGWPVLGWPAKAKRLNGYAIKPKLVRDLTLVVSPFGFAILILVPSLDGGDPYRFLIVAQQHKHQNPSAHCGLPYLMLCVKRR
jgi:hypothetical protein